ncbi:hypothetical protein DIPPA_24182 [Diplonema papillatum]|nr:hypothetical protein DIPPA_24182 [Diplonema papillatum]
MFAVSSFNVLSKVTITTAYIYGFFSGVSAINANTAAWDTYQLKIAKRFRDVKAASAPAVARSDAPLELAPGVPLPDELKEVVSSLSA